MSDVKNHSTLPTNLVSYWELEEASGTRVDSHGSNDLTDNNTVTQGTGKIGYGADFERANSEYLNKSDNVSLSITGDMSLSLWVKIESQVSAGTVEYNLCSKYLPSTNRSWGFAYIHNGGTYALQVITSSTGSTIKYGNITQTLTPGSWHHIVYLYDASASSIEIYVDGSSIGTIGSLTSSLYDGTAAFELGAQNGSYTLDGVLDEVGLWSKKLSGSEISDLYNSGSGIPYEAAAGGAVIGNNPIFFGGGM